MLALLAVGALVLLALLWTGVRLLWAGHQLDDTVGGHGGVAAKVDSRLERMRAAVETLVMPEVDQAELRPSAGAFHQRAQTYIVLGAGLLALAAALVIGFLLLV